MFEGFAGCRYGVVDIGGGGGVDGCYGGFGAEGEVSSVEGEGGGGGWGRRATVRGVYALDLRAGFGGDEFVVDEEADGLDVFAAIGGCEGDGEVGHDVRG